MRVTRLERSRTIRQIPAEERGMNERREFGEKDVDSTLSPLLCVGTYPGTLTVVHLRARER